MNRDLAPIAQLEEHRPSKPLISVDVSTGYPLLPAFSGIQPLTAAKFWAKVDRQGPPHPYDPTLGACHLWVGKLTRDGYGACRVGAEQLAHRAAWTLAVGTIPRGLLVRHSCDRRACANVGHLLLGTDRDNARDKAVRLRGKTGPRKPMSEAQPPVNESWMAPWLEPGTRHPDFGDVRDALPSRQRTRGKVFAALNALVQKRRDLAVSP